MSFENQDAEPTSSQLMAVIRTQTEIAQMGMDLNDVMALVAERTQIVTGAAGAVVELAEGDDMVYRAVSGGAATLLGLRLARKSSLSGLCVELASTLRCDDVETDDRVDRDACRRVGIQSMIVVPLIHHGDAVGALKIFSPIANAFGESSIRLLGLMSELIAAAMYHAARFGTDELFRQATRDSLTGLANRALFLDRLRHGIVKAQRGGWQLGVLMIDMDGLKPINDQLGHLAGDAAIKEIARRIASQSRQSDTVARLGGDEFAVVLSSINGKESGIVVAERIAKQVDQRFTFDGQTITIGASIGLAVYPDEGKDANDLIRKADQAMYAAKKDKKHVRRDSLES